MPANFSELRLKCVHKKDGISKLFETIFKFNSINFDLNQTAITYGTPFTSDVSFDLKIEKNSTSPFSTADELRKLIIQFYQDTEDWAKKPYEFVVREMFKKAFNHFPINMNTLYTDASAGQVLKSKTPNVFIVLNSSSETDPLNWIWSIRVKMYYTTEYNSTNPKAIFYPNLKIDDESLVQDYIPLFKSLENDFSAKIFNDELMYNYELLITPSGDTGGNFIGKATEEIVDSINNLSSSLNSKLVGPNGTVKAQLQPIGSAGTPDMSLWVKIKKGTEDLSFSKFQDYMNAIFCGGTTIVEEFKNNASKLNDKRSLPFMNVDAYRSIKIATEAFVMTNCAVDKPFTAEDVADFNFRVPSSDGFIDEKKLEDFWNDYKVKINGSDDGIIPYLDVIKNKLADQSIKTVQFEEAFDNYLGKGNGQIHDAKCYGLIKNKLMHPCYIELIWSYWHEESMMVQGLHTIFRRFQNIRNPGGKDPLANLLIDPLRPLSNLCWGYIQDEQHLLTVKRRAYEYGSHYGITMNGSAVKGMNFADFRTNFLEAFHRLLHITAKFYKQADDMTIKPDAFPVLNALKEVHLILSEGAHNQYGDLPSVARAEMLMQQWLLARPEFREFLPTRIMVAYPEPWMDRVAALNNMMGWTTASPLHFRDLGRFGEQILLSIRFGNWSDVNIRDFAANWAHFWREQIQGYIHAYQAVTGVDLTTTLVDNQIDSRPPSYHLTKRLQARQNGAIPKPSQNGIPIKTPIKNLEF